MYVARTLWPSSNGKIYQSIYLRESFRTDGLWEYGVTAPFGWAVEETIAGTVATLLRRVQ